MFNLVAALENPLSLQVSPQNQSIGYGMAQQCTATVTGSNVKTVNWSVLTGPGSVNSTGLYSAPMSGTAVQQAVVQAASTIDTATPVKASTTITLLPPGPAVAGVIDLVGCESLAQPITITLIPTSGSTIVQNVTLSATGAFYIWPVPTGAYTAHIKGAKWLARDVSCVVGNTYAANVSASLLPGDINNDNVVDLNDFALLAEAFGSEAASPNWNANADLNCDGIVDLNDFSLLAADFGLAGDP